MAEPILCTQLGTWLVHPTWHEPVTQAAMAAHIHTCPSCRHGRIQLPEDFRLDNDLTHDQCRAHFPAYYEATRPDYPLAGMPDSELVAATLHLATCAQCCEEYDVLCLLSELEERNEGE